MTADARSYWIEHGKNTSGLRAVEPDARWLGYHARSRRALQRWTIDRLRADRARYRIGVDLGCGHGDWTELIAPLCDELHACDLSPTFVEQTRSRTAWHRACHVEACDLRDFVIPAGTELVYVGSALLYLSDAEVSELFARTAARVAPGAHVVVRDWCAFNLGRRRENALSVHRPARELVRLARGAGLRCVEARSSFSIFGELAAAGLPGLQWPLRTLARVVTLPWTRASHTLRFRA